MKHALFIWGGWEGHQPKQCVERVAPLIEKSGFRVSISDTLDSLLDAELMSDIDLIVPCWTMGEIKGEQFAALREAVASGTGLGGWHGGMCDSFRGNTDYQFLTGGQFVSHPGNIKRYTVNVPESGSPITDGLGDFEVESEQYYMHVDPSNSVLATTTFDGSVLPWVEGTVMPVVWTRKWGAGQVFYSALGHAPQEFDVPEMGEIVRRGLVWAARD